MPIEACQIDNNPGVKWGESGTCYPYEDGNEESKKAATKKALAQGIASGEIGVDGKEMRAFAKLKHVEIMTPGTHNGIPIGDQEIARMEQETNESLPYLTSQIGKTAYDSNPDINLKGKLIPGVIDLNHQEDLPDSFIDIVKNATMRVYSTIENGVKKLFAEFDGLPDDVAMFLDRKYPNRSVEIMPPFFDPLLQKVQRWAIRSVGFLDETMPPAVDGMNPNFVVEFARRNEISVICCANTNQIAEGEIAMATKNTEEQKTPQVTAGTEHGTSTPAGNQPSPPTSEILEMQAKLKEFEDRMKKAEERADNAEARADKVEAVNREQEVTMFLKQLEHDGVAVVALGEGVKEQLLALPDKEVVKFAASDGTVKEVSPREFWGAYIKNFAPKVERRELTPDGEEPTSIIEMRKKQIEKKQDEIRKSNPNMREDLVRAQAYSAAIAESPQLYN